MEAAEPTIEGDGNMSSQTAETHELTLTSFCFPEELEDSKANFRFVVDLRYVG